MAVAVGPDTGRRWQAIGVIGLAQLLVMIDTTIVNIALPSAQRALGMSDGTRQWTLTAYTLAFGALLLLGGRLADRWGCRTILIVGAAGFAAMSALGGAATGPAMLIAARAGQGAFAALLAPATLSMLAVTFTGVRERARAFSVVSAIAMSGTAVGLLAGGALAEYLGWRWCLYVNLPLAVVTALGSRYALTDLPRHRGIRLDWPSAALGGAGFAALACACSGVGGALAGGGGVLLLAGFVVRQRTAASPLLPLRVIADRGRAAACLSVAATGFGMFGMFLLLTYQLQVVMGFRPLVTGLAFLPFVAGNVVASTTLTRRLLPVTGPRPLLVGGMMLLAAGLGLLTTLAPDSSYWGLLLPSQVLLGAGAGFAVPTAINLATTGVGARDSGVASAFVTTSQQLGASLGTAALNTAAAAVGATAHGYAIAGGWAAGVVAIAALIVGFLLRAQHREAAA